MKKIFIICCIFASMAISLMAFSQGQRNPNEPNVREQFSRDPWHKDMSNQRQEADKSLPENKSEEQKDDDKSPDVDKTKGDEAKNDTAKAQEEVIDVKQLRAEVDSFSKTYVAREEYNKKIDKMYIFVWIGLGVAVVAFIVMVVLLIKANKVNNDVQSMHDVKRKVNSLQESVKSLSQNRNDNSNRAARQSSPYQQNRQNYQQRSNSYNNAYNGPYRNETPTHVDPLADKSFNTPGVVNVDRRASRKDGNRASRNAQPKVRLYGSPHPSTNEFRKVSESNAIDRYIVIELTSADSTIGAVTIDDAMHPDMRKEVINGKSSYLPAHFCTIGAIASNPSNIVVDSPGEARKEGDKWIVTKPMIVKLV